MIRQRVLVVDDKENMRRLVVRILADAFEVEEADDGARALALVATRAYDVVVTDIRMPGADGFELLAAVKARAPATEVVLMTGYATVQDAVRAMKQGAFDYLEKPFDPDAALAVVQRAAARKRLGDDARLAAPPGDEDAFHALVGRSAPMRGVYRLLEKAAAVDATVLLAGETGTGKELAARAIHYHSPRKERRFVPVNCGALPAELVESELFGHARGAFTGAAAAKPGLFQEAEGGTIFLDEVGELPLPAQVKLNRVLQEKEIRRVGETQATAVNVLPCANAPRTFRSSPRTSSRSTPGRCAGPCAGSLPTRCASSRATPGRGTCASSRTSSSGRWRSRAASSSRPTTSRPTSRRPRRPRPGRSSRRFRTRTRWRGRASGSPATTSSHS